MTYAETLSQIYALCRFGMKPGLARISRLLGALGNPQNAFAVVHVVGTNGKGSTASILSSILSAGGYRTGLFTSPHLISFTERIRIDGAEIAEEDVARLAERVMAAAPEATTFFEIVTALAALHFAEAGVRVVPGASARWGSFLSRGVVLMPSYVNIGAWVGEGTMVDTWATVASCAQIGARVHLSGGVGIGGVLEPPNAVPVVVEDEAFIGSRSMITDGARVGRGAVLGAGTILNPSIPVIDAETGEEISRGVVPPWSVAVSANRKRTFPGGDFYLPCVLVLKTLTEGERHDKVALNEVLRTHSVAT